MEAPTLFSAFIAGVFTFLSPCILPLLPGYISFMSGESIDNLKDNTKLTPRLKAFFGAVAFGLGFTIIFVMLGAAATSLGQSLSQYKFVLSQVAGAIIIIFGLHMVGVFKIKALMKHAKINYAGSTRVPFFVQSFILGIAFVLGWTPCVGPILSGILALASVEESVNQGIIMLLVYSFGLWIPFLIAALAINESLAFARKAAKYIIWVERIAGGLLILIGVLLLTNNMTQITIWFLKAFPWLPVY